MNRLVKQKPVPLVSLLLSYPRKHTIPRVRPILYSVKREPLLLAHRHWYPPILPGVGFVGDRRAQTVDVIDRLGRQARPAGDDKLLIPARLRCIL